MFTKTIARYSAVLFVLLSAGVGYGQSTSAPDALKVRTDDRPVPGLTAGPSYLLSTLNVNDLKDVFPACSGGDYYVGFQLSYDVSNNSTELAWGVDLNVTLTDGVNNYVMPTMTLRMGDQTYLSTVFYNSSITCNSAWKAKITAKTLYGTVPQTILPLKVLLFKKFDNVFNATGTISVSAAYAAGATTVSWNPHAASVPATVGYDVEWVHIEEHEGFSGTAAAAFSFKEPVRVTTAATSYSHLTYYPNGQIYYRVRAIGYNPLYPDHRLTGNWFYAASPISISNHNAGHTWQLQTVFAEEGKNKKIMSYYDGTLRQRQILTNISSDNTTMVGETAYDYEGRKSVDILPVPVTAVPVRWQNLVGVTSSGGGATLTKPSGTAAWNAGAASMQQIPSNANGWLEIPVTTLTGNRMIGLSDADTDQNCTSIDFAFNISGTTLRVYENCNLKITVSGTLVVGDFLQIERVGTAVVYKKNGVVVYTSLSTSSSVLMADASFNTVGSTLSNVSISDSPLRFKPNFNVFQSQHATVTAHVTDSLKKFHYDNRDTLNSIISNLGGAGKYYSPLTAPPGTMKDYIPDAEGYVFSQTDYLNDGTGRISRQSGVGKAFKMDGAHVTRNYYGSAAKAELTRLFGNNVGNASHYKKNLVVDPNGQVSVSYLDQEDRVIATALAGQKPANVLALPSYDSLGTDLIQVNLNSKNQKREGLSVTTHKITNVAINTGYSFKYDLSAVASEIENVGCVACEFDLAITVTDPNGNALDLSSQPLNDSTGTVYARNNISAESCLAPHAINTVAIDLTFPLIGDYTVTKTLRAHELTFESVSELITQTTTVQELINEITISYELDSADCEICTSCDADDAIDEAIDEIAGLDCENILQQIIFKLKMDSLAVDSLSTYEPDSADIAAHPGYCEYLLCKKNQSGDVFDKQLARVKDWDAAVLLGYDALIDEDPFFNVDSLSGFNYKDEMQGLIDDVYLTKVDGNDLRGTLLDVTNPANDDFYVDEEGHGDPGGYHVLYIDLMKSGFSLTSPEMKEQRWQLYKSLYLEAKRKIKLTIPEYSSCDSAYVKLEMQDGLPMTEQDIAAYGEANGVGGSVSEEEVSSSFYTIRNICPGANISPTDSLSITSHLTSYFNNHPDNFYRIIILSDLNDDPDLDAIQDILTPLGCGLDSVALVDPITCARDTTIIYSSYSQIIEEGCTTCRQAALGSPESKAAQEAEKNRFYDTFKQNFFDRVKREEEQVRSRIEAILVSRYEAMNRRIGGPSRQPRDAGGKKRSIGSTQNLITSGEYAALMALYASTNGSSWTNKSGWSTANPSVPQDVTGWYGVTVNGTGNVIGLNLFNNNLTGTLPSTLGNLTLLQNLNLSSNHITGSIPSSIGSLSALVELRLSTNQLSDSIPSSIGNLDNLINLYLDGNDLSGTIPSSIGSLDQLVILDCSNNDLSGSLPSTLGNLSNLSSLTLRRNDITGKIPYQLGSLSNLVALDLGENELTDSIPHQLGNLDNLVSMFLYDNNLSGTIPSSLGNMDDLVYMYLNQNQLSGSIPSSFGNLDNLITLSLENNSLSGAIPSSLGQLANLETLSVHHNSLTGSIPVSLKNLSELTALHLHDNLLTGSIPPSLGKLASLQSLVLSNNSLSGAIPDSLGYLTNLFQLYLMYNDLTDTIPSSLGNLTQLQTLALENNDLIGPIPSTFGQLTALTTLSMQNNQLTGSIPSTLGNLTQLTALFVFNNKLTGAVPATLSKLKNLTQFIISNNYLSGNLPKLDPVGLNTVLIENNKFTFTNFLPLKQSLSGSATFTYSPQDSVDHEKNVYAALGSTLKLKSNIDRATTPSSKFEWFKNGVSLGPASTTKHTLVIPSVSLSDVATYHYKITNSGANALTLISRPQHLIISDSLLSFTYCLEYDTANQTMSRFQFTVDWNSVVQQCMENAAKEDSILISRSVDILIDEQATLFYNQQTTSCLDSVTENFYYEYIPKEYHYTLYYYDQAGNLVQTVPPAGVDTESQNHNLITRYKYNSINQLVWQKTPDAGESQFWYDDKGQLRLSQNAQQFKDAKYSYTKYDSYGRITEVGEVYTAKPIDTLKVKLETTSFPVASADYVLHDRTVTHYDFGYPAIQSTFPQAYLRNRVSYVESFEKGSADTIATYYSYDVHGNVKALLQKIPGLGNKRTDYVYDLVSGKVNYALYQYGQADQFIHRYDYDADNRIKYVYTSSDAFLFDKEADYKYYQHGPLARTLLGEYTGVQGLDYYYTLQGWIKGVNMPYAADPANDGNGTSKVGRDVFAYALGYYNGDYTPRNSTKAISGVRDSLWTRYNSMYASAGYYNGNIAWMETDLKKIGQQKGARVKGMQAMMYRYDQLHRIRQSRSLTSYSAANSKFLARTNPNEAYDENFTYNPNGNLQTLDRRDQNAALLDNFNYSYYTNTNKLRYLNPVTIDTTYNANIYSNEKLYDGITVAGTANVPAGGNPTLRAANNIDIDPGFDLNNAAAGFRAYVIGEDEGEFNYDAIGNLVWDMGNGVRIAWTPYGKVRHVSKANGDSIIYRYDAAGNRIEKRTVTGGLTSSTFYVRDASGNVMSTYHSGSTMNIEWVNPVGVTISGTTVTKPSGSASWNAGASSLQILPAGVDGYLEFKVASITGNRVVGFNDVDIDGNYTAINYAVYLNGNSLKAYTNGGTPVYDGGVNSLAVNDVIKLARVGTAVYLYKNGLLVHPFVLQSTTSLIADISISTVGSSIEGVKYFFGSGTMVTEQPIYGSSRLGVYRGYRQPGVRRLGHKLFELSNHLGNVLATVSDNVRVRTDSAWANVVNSSDYYAFGSEMPTRTYSMYTDYRYGFNGKEQDTENTWGDDIYDYGFRIYNPKIGKFLSVDPLTKSYPMLTPYQFASNTPIAAIDLDGLEGKISVLASDVSDDLPELRTQYGELLLVIIEGGNLAMQKPLEEASIRIALKELQGGKLVASNGRTYTTSRMFEYNIYDIDGRMYKNVKRGVNFGTKNFTTKGIEQIGALSSRSIPGRILSASKFLAFFLQGLPAAEAMATGDAGKMNPVGFVVDDMIAQFQETEIKVTNKLLDNALRSGSDALRKLFAANNSVNENYLLEGTSFEILQKIFKGEIVDYDQFLDANSKNDNHEVDLLFKKDQDQNLQLKSVLIRDDDDK